ncbi:MAG: PepSY-associated TM helix domain-containing protein, partial [Longimicrobiales bacterium]
MSKRVSRRRAARRLIRWTHVYVGLTLSLLLFVLAVTGSALVYKEAYWRLVYPELRVAAPALEPADHAAAIAAAQRAFEGTLRSVKMPEPGVAAYHLYLDDGEAFLSVAGHRVIDSWRPEERVMSFLFDLHAHLMAGDAGEKVGGVVALLGVLLALTGLTLWWPARRRFSLANMVPRDLSRRRLLHWHRDLGAITSPLLLILLLTGAGLVFYTTAQRILNGMFGDRVPVAAAASVDAEPLRTVADAAMVARAEAVFPGARVVFYYPPRGAVGVHEFRLRQPCELHPNGRSYVYLDGSGAVVGRTDACVLPPGEKTVHAMYPLHAGKAGSGLYKLVAFLGGLTLAALSLSGALRASRWRSRCRTARPL